MTEEEIIQLAKDMHKFDMANTSRGSHHADGLGRFLDIAKWLAGRVG